MNIREKIGKIIKNRRAELNMEQSDLQDHSEMGSTTISRVERGKANVTIESLEKILDALGLEISIKTKPILVK
ncbi:MAG: helix-turn-helix domain-containing protein [Helicobacteraceae bacterium]|nr:helix-turn-helix domain-containing protein [Helicobacteraceae bacterium]